jgi:hypothetical protein
LKALADKLVQLDYISIRFSADPGDNIVAKPFKANIATAQQLTMEHLTMVRSVIKHCKATNYRWRSTTIRFNPMGIVLEDHPLGNDSFVLIPFFNLKEGEVKEHEDEEGEEGTGDDEDGEYLGDDDGVAAPEPGEARPRALQGGDPIAGALERAEHEAIARIFHQRRLANDNDNYWYVRDLPVPPPGAVNYLRQYVIANDNVVINEPAPFIDEARFERLFEDERE